MNRDEFDEFYYSEDENDHYRIPDYQLVSMNKSAIRELLINTIERSQDDKDETLEKLIINENAISRMIQDWLGDSYLQPFLNSLHLSYNENESHDIFVWVKLLIDIARRAERIMDLDKKASRYLMYVDPGAYSLNLLARQKFKHSSDYVGDYCKNYLKVATGNKKILSKEYQDWFMFVETHSQPDNLKRVTPSYRDIFCGQER